MKPQCVIISGGEACPITDWEEAEYIIACDKGYLYAKTQGIPVNIVLGDFDSYGGEIEENIERKSYPKEKDDTDTMLALKLAVSGGYDKIKICCALGGRLDHLYGNIQAAVWAASRGAMIMMGNEQEELLIMGAGSVTLPRKEGYALSLFSPAGEQTILSVSGVKYPLERGTLSSSFPLGVSNEWAEEQADITVEQGILLVIQSKME